MITPKFKRKNRVGINVIELETGVPKVLKITALDEKTSKKFKKDLPLFRVIDMNTGEDGIIWINGGIKGAFGGEDQLEHQVGKIFEITHRGYKETGEVINEKPVEVNVYDIFEVDMEPQDEIV